MTTRSFTRVKFNCMARHHLPYVSFYSRLHSNCYQAQIINLLYTKNKS